MFTILQKIDVEQLPACLFFASAVFYVLVEYNAGNWLDKCFLKQGDTIYLIRHNYIKEKYTCDICR